MVQVLFEAHRGNMCGLWLSCARESQDVTSLACLNRDTGTSVHPTSAFTDAGCTVLQSIQEEPHCLLTAWKELEAFHVTSFSAAFSTQNIAVGNQRF